MNKRELIVVDVRDTKFLGACSVELGIGIFAILLGIFLGPNPRERIPLWNSSSEIIYGVGLGAVGGVVLAIIMLLLQQIPWKSFQALNEKSTEQILQLLKGFSNAQLIVLSLCAGVGEELLFRGWLMQLLTGDMTTVTPIHLILGLVLSSVVFGLVHPMSVAYVVVAAFLGFLLGLLYWQSNNLLAPITAHWIYDSIVVIWLVRTRLNETKQIT